MKTLVLVMAGAVAGCTAQPWPIVTSNDVIMERVVVQPTQDGYQLTFSKPTGEVTRRIWCDSFDNRCIDGK